MTKFTRQIDQDFFAAINATHPLLEQVNDIIYKDRSVVFSTNSAKDTGLHIVATSGDYQIVEALIKAGTNINAQNTHGETPIRQAAQNGHVQIVKLLCSYGANPNLDTPLHEAAFRGNLELVQILCDHNANPNHLDKERSTPLHYITCERFIGEISENHIKAMGVLIERGASPKQLNLSKLNPLETLELNTQICDDLKVKMREILNPSNYQKARQGFLLTSEILEALNNFDNKNKKKPIINNITKSQSSSKQLWQY